MMFDAFYKHIAYVEKPLLKYKFPTLLEGVDFIKFRFFPKNQTLGLFAAHQNNNYTHTHTAQHTCTHKQRMLDGRGGWGSILPHKM
jgi:hypothetical protein